MAPKLSPRIQPRKSLIVKSLMSMKPEAAFSKLKIAIEKKQSLDKKKSTEKQIKKKISDGENKSLYAKKALDVKSRNTQGDMKKMLNTAAPSSRPRISQARISVITKTRMKSEESEEKKKSFERKRSVEKKKPLEKKRSLMKMELQSLEKKKSLQSKSEYNKRTQGKNEDMNKKENLLEEKQKLLNEKVKSSDETKKKTFLDEKVKSPDEIKKKTLLDEKVKLLEESKKKTLLDEKVKSPDEAKNKTSMEKKNKTYVKKKISLNKDSVPPMVRSMFSMDPIGDKPTTDIDGIGTVLGMRLKRKGIDKAYEILGQYLLFHRERAPFLKWIKNMCHARIRPAKECYQALHEWCDEFL